MGLRFVCVLALTAVCCGGCGGAAFVAGDVDGGDAGAQVDAASEAGAPDAPLADALPTVTPITCGVGAGATSCARTCCVSKSMGNYDYHCEDGVICGANDGTGLRCNDSRDCPPAEVCCILKVGNAFASRCETGACASGEGQLCTSPLDTQCPTTEPCSSSNVNGWGLPSSYATCGGVSPP